MEYGPFARDLQSFFSGMESLNTSLVVTANPSAGLDGVAAALEVDQAQVNRLLLDLVAIGERHGIKFPSEYCPEPEWQQMDDPTTTTAYI